MVVQERSLTVEQFDELAMQVEQLLEYIGGEIVEVPSNAYVSKIAGLILTFINIYLFTNKIGHVTGEQGGYMVAGERYAPDVAFISFAKQPELARQGYNPNPPDLAVEVISSDSAKEHHDLMIKVVNYLSVGCFVWVVKPDSKQIEVYAPGQAVKIYGEKDEVDGGTVLPGFKLKVIDVFQE